MTMFCLWKRERLQKYLRDRGLSAQGRKEELVAVYYGAYYFKIPLKATAKEEERERYDAYQRLLLVGGTQLPDPFSDLDKGWVGEAKGVTLWPPTMYYVW